MGIEVRKYAQGDLPALAEIWNEVVEDGVAFPQEDCLDVESARDFFASQSYTGAAVSHGEILGLYILHPNNVGRCGHIANASYAVRRDIRGEHIGEKLVKDCLEKAREYGFRLMQFNAVVASNTHALHLYQRLGFVRLGTIPGGFHIPDGSCEDIIVHYKQL